MLTNLIHYFDIVYSFTKEKKFHLINKKVRIIRSKRKGYNEIDGNLTVRLGTNFISLIQGLKEILYNQNRRK